MGSIGCWCPPRTVGQSSGRGSNECDGAVDRGHGNAQDRREECRVNFTWSLIVVRKFAILLFNSPPQGLVYSSEVAAISGHPHSHHVSGPMRAARAYECL